MSIQNAVWHPQKRTIDILRDWLKAKFAAPVPYPQTAAQRANERRQRAVEAAQVADRQNAEIVCAAELLAFDNGREAGRMELLREQAEYSAEPREITCLRRWIEDTETQKDAWAAHLDARENINYAKNF